MTYDITLGSVENESGYQYIPILAKLDFTTVQFKKGAKVLKHILRSEKAGELHAMVYVELKTTDIEIQLVVT